ncbi:MAG: sugar phosphate isomerase/epimerase [Clostridia bacterium]|nr:sugar phosphate isomerase/epimerase [Clostridia bacterium]
MKPCKSLNVFFDSEFRTDITEQVRRVTDAGFRHLDMNFWDWCHDPRSPFMQDNWKEWVESAAREARLCDAVFTQAHAHVYNFYDFPRDSKHEIQVLRSIEGAGMLGIPWIVMHLSGKPGWNETPEAREEYFRDNIAYFRDKCRYAAQFGVGIAIENMSRIERNITTAEDLCRMADGIGETNIGFCWDTGHAHLSGQDQPASIKTLGSRLHALHIADNQGVTDEHTAPFIGTIDWLPIAQALQDIGYTGDFTFEAHNLVRKMPEPCKNAALHLMYRIGEYLSGSLR